MNEQAKGSTTLEAIARAHGLPPEHLRAFEALQAEVDRRRARRWRAALAVGASVLALGLTGRALAAGPCTQTLPSPLNTLCADSPALASELNANFQQLRDWILAPPAAVSAASSISAVGDLNTQANVNALGTVRAGFSGAQGAEFAWNTQVGGGRSEFINNRGGGGGGFSFFDRSGPSAALGTPLLTMSGTTATFNGRVGGNGLLCVVPASCEDSPSFGCGGSTTCPNNKFMVGFTDGTSCSVVNKARCCSLQLAACP